MRFRLVIPPLAVGALAAVAVTAPSSAAPASSAAARCVPKNATDAIIDDSGSMAGSDPIKLRNEGLKQLMADPDNAKRNLGALEFGSDAAPLFDLRTIGPNIAANNGVLDAQVDANAGGTNYNAAFELAKTHGANADSLIFLTDGGHNEGVYAENHKQGKPVYVIGFGLAPNGPDDDRLAKIASETGGLYKRVQVGDANGMKVAMNEINARINCRRVPISFNDLFNRIRQSKTHSVSTGVGDKSVNLTANWGTPGDRVDLTSFSLVRTVPVSGPSASKRRRRKKVVTRLKAVKRPGATFTTIKVKLPNKRSKRRGKLRFRVKATAITNPAAGLRVVTQASRSSR